MDVEVAQSDKEYALCRLLVRSAFLPSVRQQGSGKLGETGHPPWLSAPTGKEQKTVGGKRTKGQDDGEHKDHARQLVVNRRAQPVN